MTIHITIVSSVTAILALAGLCTVPATLAAELPQRKPGQWEITTTSDNPRIAAHVEDVCLDTATDALLSRFALGASQKLCTAIDVKDAGGGAFTVDAACNMTSRRMSVHGEVAYKGNSAYRETVHVRYDPPLAGRSETTSVHEAKWTGACAADMKPGDIVSRPSPTLPTGMRINLNEVMQNGQ